MKFVIPLIVLCYITCTQTQVNPGCKGCIDLIDFNDETEPKTNPLETTTDPSETVTKQTAEETLLIEPEAGFYEIDFNDAASIDEFEPCYFQGPSQLFQIKSYSDVTLEPYRNSVANHLGNTGAGFSCIQTKQSFDLTNTKVESAIFLNSNSEDDSYLALQASQEDEDIFIIYQLYSYGFEWNVINKPFSGSMTNAKIQILARMSSTATLAIEYLHVTLGFKTDPTEEATDPTEEATDPTQEATDPTEEATDPTDEATDPTEEATDPTDEATDPTDEATDPTDEATDPTEEATDPTEEATDPTEEATDPTDEETDPTEEATDPTEEATDPTEEATDPTEEETDTTEPAICSYDVYFNDLASLDEFEPCDYPPDGLHLFGIKSYADVPLEPYRSDADNYLSNLGVGYSCLQTTQSFNFETNTELHSVMYLNASTYDRVSYVAIQAALPGGGVQTLAALSDRWSNKWNVINKRISVSDSKIQIFAGANSDEVLIAIEYISIVYPCTTTTTTDHTTNPIETETNPPTDTTTIRTQIRQYPRSSNNIWIILSFSFFLTTIIAFFALFCLLYTYKKSIVSRSNPSTIPIQQTSSLRRLAGANRSGGDSVIVGIGNDVANQPKYF